jgi:hypothetical protein
MPYDPCGENLSGAWSRSLQSSVEVSHLELCLLMRGLRLFGVEQHAFQHRQLSQYNNWLRAERRGFDLHRGGDFSLVYCIPSNFLPKAVGSSSRRSNFPRSKLTSHTLPMSAMPGYLRLLLLCVSEPGHVSRDKISLVCIAPRPALGPNHPFLQWVPRALSTGVKWECREGDQGWRSCTSTTPYVFMIWCLIN